jgi:hypothetical protein
MTLRNMHSEADLQQTFPDEDWWHGEYQGRSGLFPANYTKVNN